MTIKRNVSEERTNAPDNTMDDSAPPSITGVTLIMGAIFLVLVIVAAIMISSFVSTVPTGGKTSNTIQQNENVGP